eukprot:222104_1
MDSDVHRTAVVSTVKNATSVEEISAILSKTDINIIKQSLLESLKHASKHTFTDMYLSSQSIITILSSDVVQSILTYLTTQEINEIIFVLNKEFRKLSKDILVNSYKNNLTYQQIFYDTFEVIFSSFVNSDDENDEEYEFEDNLKMPYFLQYVYNVNKLNSSTFAELQNILKKEDKTVWNLCNKFRLKAKLLAFVEGVESYWMYNIQNISVSNDDWWGNSCDKINNPVEFEWELAINSYEKCETHATTTAYYNDKRRYYGIYAFLQIDCPSVLWRKKFRKDMDDKCSNV